MLTRVICHVKYTHPRNSYSVFYQNFSSLRTKQFEFYDVSYTDYNIIRLTETWLNNSCKDLNLFRKNYVVFRSDRKSSSKTHGGGVLIAINSIICGSK
jgi:hypothetical protein